MNESLPSEPTEVDLNDPLFNAIWQVIKPWDLSRDGPPHLYAGASGTDVMTILSAVRAALSAPPAEAVRQPLTDSKQYSDGTTATGPASLPDFSPKQQILLADLGAIEAMLGGRNGPTIRIRAAIEAGITGAQE